MVRKDRFYYGTLILAMFFWGGSWVSADIIIEIAPPFTVGFFRFLIASVPFLILVKATGGSVRRVFSRSNLKLVFLAGLTGVFGYGVLFLFGMRLTTAAQGAIIAGFNPTSIAIFAHFIHKEKLDRRLQYSGLLLSFAGVVFVIGVQALLDFQIDYFYGNLIILGAMMTWGLYSSIGKEAMQEISAAELNFGGSLIGSIFFGIGAITERVWSLPALGDTVFWLNVFFLGLLVTFVSFFLYFESIQNLGATRAGGFINLVPVFGTLLSFLVLREPIYWTFIVGLALVVAGISLINYPLAKDPQPDASEGTAGASG
ncbi:DMT family transporter [Candidatus Thorarchaeota archaeon]|nr:MAG: DMT family transporter [Candidatus Thorarchaeota archaeon]